MWNIGKFLCVFTCTNSHFQDSCGHCGALCLCHHMTGSHLSSILFHQTFFAGQPKCQQDNLESWLSCGQPIEISYSCLVIMVILGALPPQRPAAMNLCGYCTCWFWASHYITIRINIWFFLSDFFFTSVSMALGWCLLFFQFCKVTVNLIPTFQCFMAVEDESLGIAAVTLLCTVWTVYNVN